MPAPGAGDVAAAAVAPGGGPGALAVSKPGPWLSGFVSAPARPGVLEAAGTSLELSRLKKQVLSLEASAAVLKEEKAAGRMLEVWRRAADEAVSPEKHDALWREHRQLLKKYDAVVKANAQGGQRNDPAGYEPGEFEC